MMMRWIGIMTLVLAAVSARAEQTNLPDLSGKWVLNVTKSEFAGTPAPRVETATFVKSGEFYVIDQMIDVDAGSTRYSMKWPVTKGEVTNSLTDNASMQLKADVVGTVRTFMADILVNGKVEVKQKGTLALSSDGKTMTREVTISLLEAQKEYKLTFIYDKDTKAAADAKESK